MWDREYPTHVEVPEDYWVCSHNIEYTLNQKNVVSLLRTFALPILGLLLDLGIFFLERPFRIG